LLRRYNPEQTVTAVSDVSLSVPKGELFGLLGPNGAGKTTLVKILCTLILPSSGSAAVAGIDLKNDRGIRAVTGLVVSDERSFYWRISVQRNLEFFAALHGLFGNSASERVNSVLKAVNLSDRRNQRFSDLSSGMRQRLAIARALLHIPKILVLDEPTRSLDPTSTTQIHKLLSGLQNDRDISILLITHDLSEAEKMCERVALMHKGRIQTIGRPKDLRRQLDPRRQYVLTVDPLSDEIQKALTQLLPQVNLAFPTAGDTKVQLGFAAGESDGALSAVFDLLGQHGLHVYTVDGAPPSLEEVFTHFTGESETGDQ
jgi:ABC-2 type transport system ATP-binding protein